MGELTAWQELPPGWIRRPPLGRKADDGWLAHRASGQRSSCRRALNCLLFDARARRCSFDGGTAFGRFELRPLQGLRDLRGGDRTARSRWGPNVPERTAPQVLTGGEAVAHAMRQIDPDVVPVYPITPQTPIIQGFARFAANGRTGRDRQRRVGAFGDERRRRRRARGRADYHGDVLPGPGPMAEVVYIAAPCGAIVMASATVRSRGLYHSSATTPTRGTPTRPGVDPALRRERAGGLRPDGHGAADRRASRCAPACPRLPGRIHDHALRRAGRALVGRGRQAVRRRATASRIPLLDASAPVDAGPVRDAQRPRRVPAQPGGRRKGRAGRRRRGRCRARAPLGAPLPRARGLPDRRCGAGRGRSSSTTSFTVPAVEPSATTPARRRRAGTPRARGSGGPGAARARQRPRRRRASAASSAAACWRRSSK